MEHRHHAPGDSLLQNPVQTLRPFSLQKRLSVGRAHSQLVQCAQTARGKVSKITNQSGHDGRAQEWIQSKS